MPAARKKDKQTYENYRPCGARPQACRIDIRVDVWSFFAHARFLA